MRQFRYTHSLILMLLTLLVAAALRLPDLPDAPPGLHYDEAANGILSADIGLRGDRPIFIASYTGKEPLFFYLAGALMRVVGDSVFTLRLTSALAGIVTVAAVYWLGIETLRDRHIALAAAALVAVSFWHVLFSRLGFRAVTQPLLQALAMAALLRGLRREQWKWLILSGIFLGLTAYTYLAARLFPVLLLLAALPLLFNGKTYRRRWLQAGVIALVGLLVLSPLLAYFIAHPDAFWVRIGQVAPDADGLSLGESYLKSLKMFFLEGDPYWRFNLPYQPLFNWFWGLLLVAGWLATLWKWRRLPTDWQRSGALLLLLAPFLMILPTALATNEIVPSNLRAIGLIPFIFYLPAVGLFAFLDGAKSAYPRSSAFMCVLIPLILVTGGMRTWWDYFHVWADEFDLFYESDGDLTAVAPFLDTLNSENKPIYMAALHYQHPTIAFLSSKYDQIKWLPQSQAVVFPAEGTAVYIYPHNSPLPQWAEPFFKTAHVLAAPSGPGGDPAFTAYEMTAPDSLVIPNPINAHFGSAITLLGYATEAEEENQLVPLTLYWRIDGLPPADFAPFVHLEDEWGYRWGQVETFAYPSAQWQPGEIVIQRVDVPAKSGTPPGIYRLRVGLFAPTAGDRLPHLDDDGRYAGDSILIENIPIAAAPPPKRLPQPPFVVDEPVRAGLRLLGYERGGETAVTGETITLGLWWLAETEPPPLTTRLELYPPSGSGRILTNTQPVHGSLPFANWPSPVFLIDHVDGRIPDDLPAGDYHLRLRILDADDNTLFTTELGPLAVEASQRLFELPLTQHPLAATFGNEIVLRGYDLDPIDRNKINLTLVWQAQTHPAADYTVFVHLLGQDGACCLWQADMMPRQNQYPTSRWLPDEVVAESYQITLPPDAPPGDYLLEVGLYIAENGRRLQVSVPSLPDSDTVILRLAIND